MASPPTLLIVDGSSLLHRAHHALPPLTAPDGRLVSAAYGFLVMFLKGLADLQPTHVAVTFDRPEPTFRNTLFPAYQAQREEKPDELYAQIPVITRILTGLGVPVFAIPEFEADDVIGTIVTRVMDAPVPPHVTVLTGDKDLLQLVREGVEVVLFRRGMTETARYDTAAVVERFGFPPERIPDFKALAGDASDNYPGVPGIGEKTATELVRQFGDLASMLVAATAASRPAGLSEKLAARLAAHTEAAQVGLRLATIVRTVPMEFDLAQCVLGMYDRDAVMAQLRELGFQSLTGRLPGAHALSRAAEAVQDQLLPRSDGDAASAARHVSVAPEAAHEEVLADVASMRSALEAATRSSGVALSAVTRADNVRSGHPLALGMAFADRACGLYPWGTALAEVASLIRDAHVPKDTHDAKALLHLLHRSRMSCEGLRWDTALLSYLLAPGSRSHDFAHVVFQELGVEVGSSADAETGPAPEDEEHKVAAARATHEAALVARLVPVLTEKVRAADLLRVYEEFERPLVPVLQRMEAMGVRLDTEHLAALAVRLRTELERADRDIFALAGHAFNIDSPPQLKVVLFAELGLAARGIKKTIKGRTLSTAASELEKLRGAHPIIEHVLRHRELRKLLSTYVEALPALVDPQTGRVHTTYHQTVTATGRLSSADPNLQNIPVAEPWGPEIRRACIAEDGWQLLGIDYSQFELRIAAALSGDRALQEAFRSGRDIHAATAVEMFHVEPEAVTKDQRRVAKAINFGILYGMGANALAVTAEIARAEAEEYIARYFQIYAGLKEWIDTTIALARTRGYVETLFGRKRFLPELQSGVPQVRAAAERMAVNMPIQGTQADLLKRAMIRADAWIRAHAADRVRMVLTVHDELVFEVREDSVAEAAHALIDLLEHVESLAVPILVEAKVGRSWGDMQRWVP
ncbi:DNA polymerase I [Candidatus Uhrbacteria bacterium]|nr:DNA polymerase I [Candidatus Uhrbacteria bacterium]